jgi:hypothetical protein
VVQEAYFMQILSHPNILCHQETIVMRRKILLVTEYCELGDMQVRKARVWVKYTRLTTLNPIAADWSLEEVG